MTVVIGLNVDHLAFALVPTRVSRWTHFVELAASQSNPRVPCFVPNSGQHKFD